MNVAVCPMHSSNSEMQCSIVAVLVSLSSVSAFSNSAFSISRHQQSAMMMSNPEQSLTDGNTDENVITILGFGSLLSLKSAQLTFPTLKHFRLGRVPNHRRVFAHPASIFFQRGIASLDTLEMSSLSCEYEENEGFICSVFEVPNEGLSASGTDKQSNGNWIPSQAFLEREEEFEIAMVPYEELASTYVSRRTDTIKKGVICRRSSDDAYISQWGEAHFQKQYSQYGVKTIWDWDRSSGLRPCPVYLRHCVLASWNCGGEYSDSWSIDGEGGVCYDSFLDDTYLVDRKTTIREYLKQYPDVMKTEPPDGLRERYGG